jgi:glutathione S-transferase
MSLTFYYAPMSTASTVVWTLAELGIPHEAIRVDLKDEADKKAKLGPVNPNLRVPVLVHDGVAIFESAAIQIHLGETFGTERGLYPAPGPARGEALKWIVWTNVSFGETVIRWMSNTADYVPAEQKNAATAKIARAQLDELIGMLEEALTDRPYLLGETFAIADVHAAASLSWATMCGVDVTPFPKTKAWLDGCRDRPAYGSILQAA